MRPTLNLNLTKKQTKAWDAIFDDTTTELGYGGASRGGKSWLGAIWLIYMCLRYEDTGYAMGRRELKNLKRTTLQTFFKACKELNIPANYFDYDQQSSVITWYNKSQIFLLDLAHQPSDPLYTWLGGFEPTAAWVDESNELPFEAIAALKSRVGNRRNKEYGIKPFLLETFNPDKGHVYNRYYKPYRDDNELEYRKFIPALPKDNPYVPEEYLRELERADKITRERLLYGNFEYDDDPGRLMNYDAINNLFTNDHVKEGNKGEKYITADVARLGRDKSVVISWKGFRGKIEKVFDKNTITELKDYIKGLANELGVPMSKVVIDEDGVGGGLKDELVCKGFVNNSRAAGWDNYRNLKTQCYFLLSEKVNNAEMFIQCNEKEKELISQELDVIKRDKIDQDGKLSIVQKDKIKEWIGRSPDYSDAIMMRLYFNVRKEAIVL